MIDFPHAPPIGTVLRLDQQEYELRAVHPHTRRDGSLTRLLVWESLCPSCGGPFTTTTGLKAKSINRRCSGCVNPNKLVKGRRGRKLWVEVIEP